MRLVEKVAWEGRKEVPSDPKLSGRVDFWMETLCFLIRLKGCIMSPPWSSRP